MKEENAKSNGQRRVVLCCTAPKGGVRLMQPAGGPSFKTL